MEHSAFPGNLDFAADDQGAFSCFIHEKLMCLFIVCETMFTIGESRAISHANDSELQAQQVAANPRRGRFSIETPLERRLKFSGDGIKEDNREAERTSVSTPKATSSTEQPETCTEAATKYYNYSVNDNEQLQANMQLTHAIFNAYYYSFKIFPRF